MPQHIAGRVSSQDRVTLHSAQKLMRVVLKNELQQLGERAAIAHRRTEQRSGALAPRDLRGRRIPRKPSSLAQNSGYIASRKTVCARYWRNRLRRFLRRHCEVLAPVEPRT